MGKSHSPLLGFNNNVRHKNRVFHIQTEDSGIKHPHIITHLFMDGGRILKSVKKSYAEHVGADAMQDTVRQMMKEQHKAMFIALRDGQFDAVVDEQIASKAKYDANAPPPPPKKGEAKEYGGLDAKAASPGASVAPPPEDSDSKPVDTKRESAAAPAMAADAAPPSAEKPPSIRPVANTIADEPFAKADSQRPPAAPGAPRVSVQMAKAPPPLPRQTQTGQPAVAAPPPLPAAASAATSPLHGMSAGPLVTDAPRNLTPGGKNRLVVLPEPDETPPTTTRDPDRAIPPPSLDIDLDAGPAPPQSAGTSALFRTNDLPPPPQNLFNKKEITSTYRSVDHGTYRGASDSTEERPKPKSSPPATRPLRRPASQPPVASAARPVARAAPQPQPAAGSPGRYAPARPATIFGQPRGKGSLFGDDLVTDKSLDEVILSYLAEDLEQSPKKK